MVAGVAEGVGVAPHGGQDQPVADQDRHIDGDGQLETIIRLDNPLTPSTEQREQEWKLEENPCTFRHSMLYMFDSPSDSLKQAFNQSASALSDIIHSPYPLRNGLDLIGATGTTRSANSHSPRTRKRSSWARLEA